MTRSRIADPLGGTDPTWWEGSLSSFEFIMVLVSIIMGLGITTLLSGTVNALRADTLTKPGLIHGLWVLFLLLFHIATWLLRWRAADRPQWTGPEVVAFLVAPIVLFALASLVFPRETREVDLNTYFIENRRLFFGLLAFLYVAVFVGPFVFYDVEAFGAAIGVEIDATGAALRVLIPVSICGLLAWSSNAKLHLAFAVISLVLALVLVGGPLLVLSA